jgi:hypothetical protein
MERELEAGRAKAGLVAAKKLGLNGGRRQFVTDAKIRSAQRLLRSGALQVDKRYENLLLRRRASP